MELFWLVAGMVVVGAVMGVLGGMLWKQPRPFGIAGDLAASIFTTVVIGLIDWYIIPEMGFSDKAKQLGIIFEPPFGALLALWIMRESRED